MKRASVVALGGVLLLCISFVTPVRNWLNGRLHRVEPFAEVKFFRNADDPKPIYVLFLQGQHDLTTLRGRVDGLRITRMDPSGEAASMMGEGTVVIDGHSIILSSNGINVDGRKLPSTPPYSVITRSGKVVIGEVLRRFD